MNAHRHLVVATLLLLAATSAAQATIINVPADQPTIQAGVNAATAGDTVLVAPGIYFENVKIWAKSITLASHYILDGDPQHITETVINGSTPTHPDTGSCVIMNLSLDGVLQGFTLTGGTGTAWFDPSDGRTYREGGGVLTDGGNPQILNNVIIRNEAVLISPGVTSAGGGGIRTGFGMATYENNVIAYNEGRYGGGIVAFHAPVIIRNNVFYRNFGGQAFGGGGLWITSGESPSMVVNNTIIENSSTIDGGGILVWLTSVTIKNNILRGNTATNGEQIRFRTGGAGAVTYNDVEGGWAGTGNIDVDPGFASPEFLLDPASPCVDAGDPAGAYNDPTNPGHLGEARPPAQGTITNDMGAYGGPASLDLPLFSSVSVTPNTGSLDFDSTAVLSTTERAFTVNKQGFGVLTFDSIVFAGSYASALSSTASLPLVVGPEIGDSLFTFTIEWTPDTYGILDDTLRLYHDGPLTPSPIMLTLGGTAPGADGDTNLDGVITSADIIYLVGYVFKGGPAPKPIPESGDANCDGVVTSSDVIFLVNHVFKGGPAPDCS